MARILIIGQVPKEIGGTYTTGVANVILALTNELVKENTVAVYATNYRPVKAKHNLFKIFWPQKIMLIKLLIKQLFKINTIIKEILVYQNNFGIPAFRFFLHRLLIKDIANGFKPDIIHCHGLIYTPLIPYLNLNIPVVTTLHGIVYKNPKAVKLNQSRGIDLPKLFKNGSKIPQHVTYLTNEMRKIGEDDLSFAKEKGIVISNGVDASKFYFCRNSRIELRKEFNLKEEEYLLLSIGALSSHKNHLQALDFLSINKINCVYWIIGKGGELKNEILKKIADNNLNEKVRLFDYVNNNELFKYYSACDFYFHPSTSEGQALVVLEALACGCPSLVNKDIQGTLGLENYFLDYVKLIDLNAKSYQISKKISNETRYLLAGKSHEKFNWKVVSKKYLEFYTKVLQEKSIN